MNLEPSGAVPLGTTLVIRWAAPPPGWTLGISVCCTSLGGLQCPSMVPFGPELVYCLSRIGEHEVRLEGTDDRNCPVLTRQTVTVLPPDAVAPQPGDLEATGPQFHAIQYWKFTAGGEPLGDCYDACVDENIQLYNKIDAEWDDVGFGWSPDGGQCPSDDNLAFDYKPSLSAIKDFKRGAYKDPYTFQPGEKLYTYRQKVGIALSRCNPCGPLPPDMLPQDDPCRWYSSDWHVFLVFRLPDDGLYHDHVSD